MAKKIEKIGGFAKDTAKNGKEFTEVNCGEVEAGDELLWIKKNGKVVTYLVEGLGRDYQVETGEYNGRGMVTVTKQRAYIKKTKVNRPDGTVKTFK